MRKFAAVILGSQVNALNIVRELQAFKVSPIFMIDSNCAYATTSKYVEKALIILPNASALKEALEHLRQYAEKLVIYPTSDHHLEQLIAIEKDICEFCFIPAKTDTINSLLDKSKQYQIAKAVGVATPESIVLKKDADICDLESLPFPIIIKPIQRHDILGDCFRSLIIKKKSDIKSYKKRIRSVLSQNIHLLASEIIPGDGSSIYAYVAYVDNDGTVSNDWIGRKLSQTPNDFGTCSSASNEGPETLRVQGQKLLKKMDVSGFFQPEFKWDSRDNTFKLMEVNLRSMKWHRMGYLSGVFLHYTQWQLATKKPAEKFKQDQDHRMHYVALNSEIYNLLRRKRTYAKTFVKLFFKGKVHLATFSLSDLAPTVVAVFPSLLPIVKRVCRGGKYEVFNKHD